MRPAELQDFIFVDDEIAPAVEREDYPGCHSNQPVRGINDGRAQPPPTTTRCLVANMRIAISTARPQNACHKAAARCLVRAFRLFAAETTLPLQPARARN
jgi:hypothetical protein